jgi:hypothetical protein
VIPEFIREDMFQSLTEVDELLDFSRTAFSTPDRKCCANAQECAFTKIFNYAEGTEAAQNTPWRYQSNRHSYHQHLETDHEALFKIKLKLDVSVQLFFSLSGLGNAAFREAAVACFLVSRAAKLSPHIATTG